MSDAVQQIKDRLNIIDVVSPYVELHKAGKNFKGKSPFSAEKTPSFYVSPDRGMYYCFSTSQGGDIFTFVQAMEGVDFKGALKILAEKAGVELVAEDPQKRSERDRLFAALEAATEFYVAALDREPSAQAYLADRGVRPETIHRWRIGYAPGPPQHGWRETKSALEAKGYTTEELLKAGLIKRTDSGKDPFDVFRDRIVFPMAESSGRVVAFSGRILDADSDAPKYVNSPETQLYKKSELLFGYDKAKEGIRKLNFTLIVEGQFDVVMCHQAGYANTVAVSGTALTLHHVQLFERLSKRVVLALDADRAGINAMQRGAELMLARGLDVKVAELPLGKDPADLIQSDPTDFKRWIGKSVHIIEFLLHVLRREYGDDRTYKLKAREEILPFVLLLPSRIDQEHFVSLVAESLKTTEDAIRYELDRLRESQQQPDRRRAAASTGSVATKERLAVVHPPTSEVHERAYAFLLGAQAVVPDALARRIETELAAITELGSVAPPAESELAGVVFRIEQLFATMPELAVKEEVVARLNHLRTGLLRKRIQETRHDLLTAEERDDHAAVMQALETIREFETHLRRPAYEVEQLFAENA